MTFSATSLLLARIRRSLLLAGEPAVSNRIELTAADRALLAGHPSGLSVDVAFDRLATAMWDAIPDHVALLDADSRIVSVNRAWRRHALANGGDPMAGVGQSYLDVCERAVASGEPEAERARLLVLDALSGRSGPQRLTYPCGPAGGHQWFRMQVTPLPGGLPGAVVMHSDVTADKQREAGWEHRALHDPLTGLPNRALLVDRLEHAVAAAARTPSELAVLYLDLDGFKQVNDTFGHHVGDALLREVAQRMNAAIRSGDTLGRWGGDEFLVIAERLGPDGMPDEVIRRLVVALAAPVHVGGVVLRQKVSVGVARLTEQTTVDELVRAADADLAAGRDVRRASAGLATVIRLPS